MGCERTLADYDGTRRAELVCLIEGGGVREGDTLCLRAQSDLGQGAAIKRHLDRLAAMGVTVEIVSVPNAPKSKGRPKRFNPTPDDAQYLCDLWYSPAERAHVLERATERMGMDVKRDKLNHLCGPRSGARRFEPQKEDLK